jgi:hypothetical protein
MLNGSVLMFSLMFSISSLLNPPISSSTAQTSSVMDWGGVAKWNGSGEPNPGKFSRTTTWMSFTRAMARHSHGSTVSMA